jgi:hypothetical protein
VSIAVADAAVKLGDASAVELVLPPPLLLGGEVIVCAAEKVRDGKTDIVAASDAELDALPPAAVPDAGNDRTADCDAVVLCCRDATADADLDAPPRPLAVANAGETLVTADRDALTETLA